MKSKTYITLIQSAYAWVRAARKSNELFNAIVAAGQPIYGNLDLIASDVLRDAAARRFIAQAARLRITSDERRALVAAARKME